MGGVRVTVDEIATAVRASVAWLDAANGRDEASLTFRMLKLVEEAGEAAAAWIGHTGANPRKGVTHTVADVAGELADVALTAMIAIESLGVDHQETLRECAVKIGARLEPDRRDREG
jgi:NTP pyrophosphatase (non-canonical NTP hydrolase)